MFQCVNVLSDRRWYHKIQPTRAIQQRWIHIWFLSWKNQRVRTAIKWKTERSNQINRVINTFLLCRWMFCEWKFMYASIISGCDARLVWFGLDESVELLQFDFVRWKSLNLCDYHSKFMLRWRPFGFALYFRHLIEKFQTKSKSA